MAAIPCLDESHLEAICEVIGDTSSGLTGSENVALPIHFPPIRSAGGCIRPCAPSKEKTDAPTTL
jgi:hypothetical protein